MGRNKICKILWPLFLSVLWHPFYSAQYIHRATKYSYCCNQISEYPSCQKACEQVSLLSPKEIRYQKLPNVHLLCPAHLEKFWSCMNSVLQAVDQAYGWLGWPCCNLAISQNCFISCVTSTSKSQLYKSCRQSEELTFYQCLKKQEEGEICCSNTANQECKQACWRIFKKESSPTQDDKLSVQRKCGASNKHVMRCIQNYTRTTPARNPAENLKCCQESSNATCRERCRQILLNSTTEQEIVDKLIENCGEALPNNALWQCFIRNSEVNEGNGKKDMDDDLFEQDGGGEMLFNEPDSLSDDNGISYSPNNGDSYSSSSSSKRRNQNRKEIVSTDDEENLYENGEDHHRHPTSKLDIAGLDAVKLQCCSKAVTQICMDLCVKSYSIEANNNWNEFSEHCQYNPVETNLVTCLFEVDEPCTLGCENLKYCGDLFNGRDVELFRSCKRTSDSAARELMGVWGSTSTITLPMLDIPVHDINLCSPNEWRAIACVLEVKPCHPRTHTSLICRVDCLDILSKCVNREKLLPGQSPEGLCNILSPVDPDQPCISVSDYMNHTQHDRHGAIHSSSSSQHQSLFEDRISSNDIWDGGDDNFLYQTSPSKRVESYWHSIPVNRFRGSVCKANRCGKEELCTADRQFTCGLGRLEFSQARAENFNPTFSSEREEVPLINTIEYTQTYELPLDGHRCFSDTFNKGGTTKAQSKQDPLGKKSGGGKGKRKQRNARKNGQSRNGATLHGKGNGYSNHTCRSGCTLGEVSAFVVPHGSFVQLPINGKSLNCPRVCLCSPHNQLTRCTQLPCSGINHCWIQDSVKLHLTQFRMECNFCACFNGKTTCTLRYCPSVFWSAEERMGYTGLPCNCPPHFVPVCATNGRTYPSACVARCSGFSDDSFEYGACPMVASDELSNVCKGIGGAGSYNPCGAKSPATISSSGLMCLPFRQICLSAPIDNYKPSLKLLEDNARIPISTCPQYLCVDKRLECDNTNGNVRSQAICSLLRDNDYRYLMSSPSDILPPEITKANGKRDYMTLNFLTTDKADAGAWKCLKPIDHSLNKHRDHFSQDTSYDSKTVETYEIIVSANNNKHGSTKREGEGEDSILASFTALPGEPVCGYDGETYPDECRALLAGALVDYPGPCRSIGALRPRNPLDTNINQRDTTDNDPLCRNVICPKHQRYYEWIMPTSDFFRFHHHDSYFNSKATLGKGGEKKYRVTCIGVTPPGACCPICASEIRVVYSQEMADTLAKDSEFGPVTVAQITTVLRRHLTVPQCDIYGYLSIERDLVFLVVPLVPKSLLQGSARSGVLSVRKRFGKTDLRGEKTRKKSIADPFPPDLMYFMIQDADLHNSYNNESVDSKFKSSGGRSKRLVVIPRAPFPFSPLHVEACNREAQRLSALIGSHNPTLTAELPMSILLGSTVRSPYATTTVSSGHAKMKIPWFLKTLPFVLGIFHLWMLLWR